MGSEGELGIIKSATVLVLPRAFKHAFPVAPFACNCGVGFDFCKLPNHPILFARLAGMLFPLHRLTGQESDMQFSTAFGSDKTHDGLCRWVSETRDADRLMCDKPVQYIWERSPLRRDWDLAVTVSRTSPCQLLLPSGKPRCRRACIGDDKTLRRRPKSLNSFPPPSCRDN